jgi:hypothetical protein
MASIATPEATIATCTDDPLATNPQKSAPIAMPPVSADENSESARAVTQRGAAI